VCVLFARCLELKREIRCDKLSCERDATSKHGRQFVLLAEARGWGTGETGEISLEVVYNVQSICHDFK
jgi:hypothetical protein